MHRAYLRFGDILGIKYTQSLHHIRCEGQWEKVNGVALSFLDGNIHKQIEVQIEVPLPQDR